MYKLLANLVVSLGIISNPFLQLFHGIEEFEAVESAYQNYDPQQLIEYRYPGQEISIDFVPGELIIGLREGVSFDGELKFTKGIPQLGIESIDLLNRQMSMLSIRPLIPFVGSDPTDNDSESLDPASENPLTRIFVLQFPENANISNLVNRYQSLVEIAFAEPNYIYQITEENHQETVEATQPNDTRYILQWYLPAIDAETAWDISTGSISVTIAILDTGINYNHEDFGERVLLGYDFVNNDDDPLDDHGHGTAMAGIIAAETNNNTGIAGVDWNARLLVIKVSDSAGISPTDRVAQGINYAVDNGADIINLSLGDESISLTVRNAINNAYNNNVTVIASAGNNMANLAYYPASFPHVMSVAAVNSSDQKTLLSNYHYAVDLTAPGANIHTTQIGGSYANTNGTSASTAIVSGLAGLVKAIHPDWTPDEIMAQIASSSVDIRSLNPSYENTLGAGRVDADDALGPIANGRISFAGYEIDDSNGDGDGQVSPGDLVDLRVALKSYDALTTGITATLTTSDTYFICGTGVITYTDMAFGVITPSSPLTCTIGSNTPIGYKADFDFTAFGAVSGTISETFSVEVHPNPKDGWPVNMTWQTISSPALYDIDENGLDEIFLGSINNNLNAWNITGTLLSGWPQTGGNTYGTPAIADIDRDGVDEIIVPGRVYEQDGSYMAGWPQDIPRIPACSFIFAAPAVGDVTGDGFLNIVFGTWDQHLHVYNLDGTPADGWPQEVGGSISTSAALANLDSDPALEIVVSTSPIGETCGTPDSGGIHVFNGDGTYMPGWPQLGYPTDSSPSVGDIDNDGELEIVAADYAFEIDGSMIAGFPLILVFQVDDSPALADIDGNGVVDIVIADHFGYVYVVEGDGSILSGWPVNTGHNISSSPIIVDLNGDDSLEVVVTTWGHQVFAWDSGGNLLPGFPLSMGEPGEDVSVTSSPAASDVEGDGRLDLFTPAGGTITKFFAWEMEPGSFNPNGMPWSQYNHDIWNTGTYGYITTQSEGAITINDFDEFSASSLVTLTLSAPGATEMMISNDIDFTDSNWITMTQEITWTVASGVGVRTVYAKFKFPDMHESDPVFDDIYLDETLPVTEITYPMDGAMLLARRSISILGTATDENFAEYDSYIGIGTSPDSWIRIGAGTSEISPTGKVGTIWTDNLEDGMHALKLSAEDTAGNLAEDQIVVELGRIRDTADTLTPTLVMKGDPVSFDVEVTNPITEDLQISTGTIIWLNDLDPTLASRVPSYNPPGPFDGTITTFANTWIAQTFTVSETVLLSRVGIPITFGAGVNLKMEIRPLDDNGKPTIPVLANSSASKFFMNGEAEMIFEDVNCWLQAGESYAVVIKPTISLAYSLLTQLDGSLPGSAYQYIFSEDDVVEDWNASTFDIPLYLYQPLSYSATLTSETALPALGTASLFFDTSIVSDTFNVGIYTPTITFSGTEGITDEFFSFTRSNVNNIIVIGPPPTITISDSSVIETNIGSTNMVFSVDLSWESFYDITVNYTTTDVEAQGGLDYGTQTGVLTIPSHNLSGEIIVPIYGDRIDENDETFTVDLSDPSHSVLGDDQAIGTIVDNDDPPSISINNKIVLERNSVSVVMPFTVSLSHESAFPITVDFATADIEAEAGLDYIEITGTLAFTPGVTAQTINVDILGDYLDEDTETFEVDLSNPSNATLGDSQGIGTIMDNDPPPELSISDASVVEGDAGTVQMTLTVTLSTSSSKNIAVDYETVDGDAVVGEDYTYISGTLDIPTGEISGTVTVDILGDLLDESNETFTVVLSNPSNANISDGEGMGVIEDNDPPPELWISDAGVVEGDAGTVQMIFTATLSTVSGQTVTVDYETLDGEAVAGLDYVYVMDTLSIPAGEISGNVIVEITGDLLDEVDETFTMILSNPSNTTIIDGEGIGTILDNDPLPSLSINDSSIVEGNIFTKQMEFVVSLSNASGKLVTVNYETVDGTAIAGLDYTYASGMLSIPAGATSGNITVDVLGDLLDENNEAFTIVLSNPISAELGDDQAIGTIIDNEDSPSISISNSTSIERNVGSMPMSFNVTLSHMSVFSVTVDFATADVIAVAGLDYVEITGTLTFDPGDNLETISVDILGDILDEPSETFEVNLSNPSNATLDDAQGIGTILDNDPSPNLSVADSDIQEGDLGTEEMVFVVSLSTVSGQMVTVDYETVDGSAIADFDYMSTSGTLSIPAGNNSGNIIVQINGDLIDEINETFTVELSNPGNANLSDPVGLGIIVDNDPEVSISISDASLQEGDSGTKQMVFDVSLSTASGKSVDVEYETIDGSALAGVDYVYSASTLTIPAGNTSGNIIVDIIGDLSDEVDETFTLKLSNPGNAYLVDDEGIGTIQDNDPPPDLSINDPSIQEGDAGTKQMVFVVTLSSASGKNVSVDYETVDDTAIAGLDYIYISNTLTIPPGEISGNISVDIIGDSHEEPAETFMIVLDNPVNADFSDNVGVGTIINDDIAFHIYLPLVLKNSNSPLKMAEKTNLMKSPKYEAYTQPGIGFSEIYQYWNSSRKGYLSKRSS